jgi:hypothetical protein
MSWRALLLLLASGCFRLPPALSDAGHGSCPDGGAGPLGTCVGCDDACVSESDCPAPQVCLRGANGCLSCALAVDAGPDCQSAPCRKDSDCCGGAFCLVPGAVVCGGAPCPPPTNECGPQTPCGTGQQCVTVNNPCCAPMNPSSICEAACTATSCGAGEICDADAGCLPQSCERGFQCPADATCAPDAGDEHGCVLMACSGDPDCSGGFCVGGFCQSRLGECQLPVP